MVVTRRKAEIVNIDDAVENNSCVLTFGHFSTIHPGHIRYLNQAKNDSQAVYIALMGDEEVKNLYMNKRSGRSIM